MLSARCLPKGRPAAAGARPAPSSTVRTLAPCDRAVQTRANSEGFFSDAFKQALQTAMERDEAAAADMYSDRFSSRDYSGSSSRDYGYSRSDDSSNGYSRQPPPAEAAGPMLQVLATALGQSRATLERLQAEEAEIENLIQRERKQVERLEWILEKVQQDYAYFNSLQRRFEQR